MSDASIAQAENTRETLLVVDGHSLAFRAYFALPVDNFSTSNGQPTNAIWGFATMLSQVIEAEHPSHLAVAFDVKGGTFRSELLPQYKGTRDAAPEELLSQLPLIQEMLDALGVTYIEKPGYEGDDVIATLATMGKAAGMHSLVLSGDRDAFQLVDEDITVLYPGHHFKDLKHMTPEAIVEKYHVTAQQYPDLAALRGENADNIPGVPGVGDGFAAKWINQYGSLQGIVDHADEIKGKKGQALRDNIDQVLLNRKVNALVRDLDLDVNLEECVLEGVDAGKVQTLFSKLEFGVRTKSRVLKTFNSGRVAQEEPQAPAPASVDKPESTVIEDVATLQSWMASYAGNLPNQDDEKSSSASDASIDAEINHDMQCSPLLETTWVLNIEGDNRPGRARLDNVTLLIGSQAAIITAKTMQDASIRESILDFAKQHRSSMVMHGYKEMRHMADAVNMELPMPQFDTKLAGYLVHPDFHADSLEKAAAHFLDIHIDEPKSEVQGQLDLEEQIESDTEFDQALFHVSIIAALTATLAPLVDARRQFGLLRAIELPVSQTLYRMEHAGARIDMRRLTEMREQFGSEARQAQEIAWEQAGSQVNLQSPKQLQTVLFEDMGLKPTRRTKSGGYTTNAAVLQDLYVKSANNERANTFLGALLRHRETNKLKQIVQTLLDAVNREDGRIHTTFEQTVAATGRLSSVDPNLQNIPNRNASGREIRSAFVPGEGYASLLSCDYSQVELRIMAEQSGDEALIEAFKSGTDFHKYVASLVYGIPVDQIDSDQRSHVKAMSYGLAYGLSTYGLAQQLKISPAAADVLKEQYFSTFGKVHDYLESLVSQARRKGYTETMFGRRRYFPGLTSTNRTVRDAAERGALNAPIQGSAADIMKLAMIRSDKALQDNGCTSRIILQIHDELVIEVAPGETEQVSALVKDAMEHAVDIAVPLDVSIGVGADWQLAAH
ncbi:MAG: DNA polymerase I [Bifidobacterium tsurumiense]|uniref:DNA polymerase I n=1 Tax=Bifidobacterium tsurumiense TaxID=356829 RepID=UPI002A7F5212|nr:DNA polymerase I [Bifidobacterium tsurumiense]MDY4678339.1 DNA polymerase I [Bifidobacterium tsurumiense]